MTKKFVFGETKVAKTSEEIREHSESKTEAVPTNDAPATDTPVCDAPATETASTDTKPEEEKTENENAPVTETDNTQQEKQETSESTTLDDKDQKKEEADKPAATRGHQRRSNTTDRFALKGVKTENGIVVNVPMDDYMQLTMLKIQTGRTLKVLALQAIHEFVKRNKI